MGRRGGQGARAGPAQKHTAQNSDYAPGCGICEETPEFISSRSAKERLAALQKKGGDSAPPKKTVNPPKKVGKLNVGGAAKKETAPDKKDKKPEPKKEVKAKQGEQKDEKPAAKDVKVGKAEDKKEDKSV